MHDVVKPAFQQAQKLLAGVLRRARGKLEVAAELALQEAVETLELLLLAQALAVLRLLAAADVHARRLIAAFDGALGAFTARAFQIQLDALTSAQLANRVGVTSHRVPKSSP